MTAKSDRAKARRAKLREDLACPWCARRFEYRDTFRRHVVLNICGRIDEEASVSMMVADAKLLLEAEFQRLVIEHAERNGWMTNHMQKAFVEGRIITPTAKPGFPDVILIRPPRLLFLELKRERGSVATDDQKRHIRQLQRCEGVDAFVVRPSDWPAIHRRLTAP